MNFPYFVSQRIRKPDANSFSSTVTKIGVGSIAVGLSLMIISFGVLFGFKDAIKQKLFSLSGHIKVVTFSDNQSVEDAYPISNDNSFYKNYSSIPEIKHFQAVATKSGILKTQDEILGVIAKGIGQDFDFETFSENIIEGKTIDFSDSSYSKEILISKIISNKLRLKVGDNVIIYFLNNPDRPRKLSVKGIYETSLEEFDKNLIITDLRLLQKIAGWGKDSVGSYEIVVKDFEQLRSSAKIIQEKIPADMRMTTVVDQNMALFDWLGMLDRNMVIFLPLIAFVAAFNMISILLVLMLERTPMIGLLKALGSPNWQIRKIFLWNGISMITKGLVLGNVIGIGLCSIQKHFKIIPLDSSNYYMNYVPITLDWTVILLLNLATLALVTTLLTIPTFVITRIQPVKAIAFRK
jgi:lipoprotein-releasing system permease protein